MGGPAQPGEEPQKQLGGVEAMHRRGRKGVSRPSQAA